VFPERTGRIRLPGLGKEGGGFGFLSPVREGWRDHGFAILPVRTNPGPGHPSYRCNGKEVVEVHEDEFVDVPLEPLPMAVVEEPDPEPMIEVDPPLPRFMRGMDADNEQKEAAPGWPPRVRMPEAMAEGLPQPAEHVMPPLTDEERREICKDLIRKTVADAVRYDNQVQFEMALMAVNGNVNAQVQFKEQAAIRRTTVEALTRQIIEERNAFDRKAQRIHTLHDLALAAIDVAEGDAIGKTTNEFVGYINGVTTNADA
jgi:hypothetical protein